MNLRRFLFSFPTLTGAVLLALYALAGFVAVPALLEREIPRRIDARLNVKGEVAEIRVNPFLLTLEMRGFRLSARDGEPLLALERLFVDLEASSLLRWAWTFEQIALEQPALSLRIDPRGQLNIASLVSLLLALDDAPAARTEPQLPRALVRRLALAQGRVSLFDESNPRLTRANIENIALEIRDVSTLVGEDGRYSISAKLPGEGSVAWRGRISLAPIASDGEVEIKALKISRVVPFLPLELRIEEPPGTLDLGLRYRMSYSGGKFHIGADNMTLEAAGLEMRPAGAAAPILQFAEAKLRGGSFDLEAQRLEFAELAVRGGRVTATLDESGIIDWERIVGAGPPAAADATAPTGSGGAGKPWRLGLAAARIEDFALRVTDASRLRPSIAEIERADAAFSATAQTGETLAAAIENLTLDLSKLTLRAQGASEPLLALEQAKLEGGHLDLGTRSAALRAVRLSGGMAQVVREADGSIALLQLVAPKRAPPDSAAPISLAVEQTALERFAVRVADKGSEPAIQYDFTDLRVRLGGFATAERKPMRYEVAAEVKQGGGLKAAGSFDPARLRADAKLAATRIALAPLEPVLARHVALKLASGNASADGRVAWDGKAKDFTLTYAGTAALEDVLLDDSAGKRLLGWKALAASGIALDTGAARVAVEDVRLLEPAGAVIIDKERNFNLAAALRKPAAAVPAEPGKADAPKPFTATVERLRVEKGAFDFADQGLVLPFAAHIQDLNGAVTGLSSVPGARAAVKLEGQVGEYGLARIDGTLNAFAPKSHTDLAVTFRNVDLPAMSPYSATFAGRMIASGRVSLDLEYKIENSELRGENKVVLEKFVLGDRVESPTALNLPLDLAIALLTDADGRIDVSVPVRGNLDNPEFAYGHLVWQAIRTVIVNIVTAPFRALGSLFGGGPPPEDIVFDAGSARLLPPEREKLARVAKSLQQRPKLKLMVQGNYNPELDGRALRDAAARRALAERLEVKLAPGEVPAPVPFENAKVQRALEALLAERTSGEGVSQYAAAFEKQAGRKADRVNPMLAVVGRGSADRQFYEGMFQRLVELEPLPPTALSDLARQRGETIVKELAGGPSLPAERIGQKGAEAVSQGVNARLSVEAL